jgi:hypothetical protein
VAQALQDAPDIAANIRLNSIGAANTRADPEVYWEEMKKWRPAFLADWEKRWRWYDQSGYSSAAQSSRRARRAAHT